MSATRASSRVAASKAGGGKTKRTDEPPARLRDFAIKFVECPANLGEKHGQFLDHARRLRSLTGEHERDRLPGPCRPGRKEDASGIIQTGSPLQRSLSEPAADFRSARRDFPQGSPGWRTCRDRSCAARASRAWINVWERSPRFGLAPEFKAAASSSSWETI